MRSASEMFTSGATRGGGTCASTTASCGSTVSRDWQHGQVSSIAGAGSVFLAMRVLYASESLAEIGRVGSETEGRRQKAVSRRQNTAEERLTCAVRHGGLGSCVTAMMSHRCRGGLRCFVPGV